MQLCTYRILTIILLFSTFTFSSKAQWQLDIETGAVWNGYNDVRVPNDATPFSLTENNQTRSIPFFRAEVLHTFNKRHTIRALYAPLQINATGNFIQDITFNDEVFPEGTLYHGNYVFNSYRLTYRYDFSFDGPFRYGLGLTGKVRDAKIEIIGNNQMARTTDLGVVPLIHLYAEWYPAENLSLLLVGDALWIPGTPGRAEDVLLALRYHIDERLSFKAGYRILEGGADVDQVYNFSLFHYAVVGVMVNF
jgi:hypothetical protein